MEEVNQNFYEYLAIPSDATTSEVKRAYRRLSLVLHPDRNDADDAELKFRLGQCRFPRYFGKLCSGG